MKTFKLFTKTYIFTMMLMVIIIFISHIMLFLFLPKFYIDKKEEELLQLSEALWKKVDGNTEENVVQISKSFAETYDVNILLQLGRESYKFQGYSPVNMYIDSSLGEQRLSISSELDKTDGGEDPSDTNNNLQNIQSNNSSDALFHVEYFTTSTRRKGVFQVVMTLQPVEEARQVIFMIFPYSIGISIIFSILVAYIYARAIVNPIKRICNTTKRMEKLEKDVYCIIRSNDEIGLLAENVNSLYDTLWNTIHSLEKEMDDVRTSEKMKVDFLRSASHELKTPLMSLHIMVENMIYNVGKYKDHETYLKKCQNILENLNNMIQEILDTSGLNSWKEYQGEEEWNLHDILTEVIEPYLIIMKSKKITLKYDFSDFFIVKMNKKMFIKSFSNIISNAVHYTDEGKNIRIYCRDAEVIIENDCTPITREHLEHIFEAFYRPHFDRNRNAGGNGLGLYIVDQVFKLNNISYTFEAIATGMRFTVYFQNKKI